MQERQYAVFNWKPTNEDALKAPLADESPMSFAVEKIVLLPDTDYTAFCAGGLIQDQAFLAENRDSMWFNPAEECWHCLLVKSEASRDGILVEAEGFSYARYAAYIPDCSALSLEEIPVQYEYPLRPPAVQQLQRSKRHDRER